ncbi:MAG: carbamoyltransferase HypF [Lachnospiraceae bacterium]|nr:carbamoyltransferase HypF [Lachnospiraceae bacterium]
MVRRERIRLYGIVQGIGFRPFVSRLADELDIEGDVCNKGSYVEIHAQAEENIIDAFKRRLVSDAPAVSAIVRVETEDMSVCAGNTPSGSGERGADSVDMDNMSVCAGNIPSGSGERDADSVEMDNLSVCADNCSSDGGITGADSIERTDREPASGIEDPCGHPEKCEKLGESGDRVGSPEEGADTQSGKKFRIIKSMHEAGEIFVSPDLAICPACRRELMDPRDRRYLHPFINCTDCGPRLTILDGMPYDRIRTSMKKFPMCPECEWEYTHPETRRFHAQPVCCNDCGPEVYIYDLREKAANYSESAVRNSEDEFGRHEIRAVKSAVGHDAIRLARKIVREGGVIAIKGIGGFHLCCDAANDAAVARLRTLKNRPMKPFAVMMRDMEAVKRECFVPEGAEKVLDGVQKPILILKRKAKESGFIDEGKLKAEAGEEEKCIPDVVEAVTEECRKTTGINAGENLPRISSLIAPGNDTVGVMLPYAPIQILLFNLPDGGGMTDTFVMTSGNPSGAPICRNDAQALLYLSPMCDAILSNDRDILLRSDDSVMQWAFGKPYMVRRSRGYSPLPFVGPKGLKGSVLAIGGELKNSFCLAKDELLYPSPYVGDLMDLRSVRAMEQGIGRMEELLEIKPELVVCDMHPRYNSTAFAEETGLPCLKIQHHYAHILSCMAENGVTEPVIGISFDGTGYGTDGTVWGGEFLLSGPDEFRRMGSIAPFRQAGGDLASKEGWRIALSLLLDVCGSEEEATAWADSLGLCSEKERKAVFFMLRRNVNTVVSTSAGRLFDAVSAILGIRRASTFEGEASVALETEATRFLAEHTADDKDILCPSLLSPDEEQRFLLPTNDIIRHILNGLRANEPVGKLAYDFHAYLANGILAGAMQMRDLTGIGTVALSGGCFQNMLLLHLCRERLEEAGFACLTHSLVPPNDGGIALGQAFAGMWRLNNKK